MLNDRMQELLKMAADKFENGGNPFDASVLREHHVTLDECMDLSEGIATIIRGYLSAPKEIRMRVMMSGVADASGLDPDMVVHMMNKQDALNKLKNL